MQTGEADDLLRLVLRADRPDSFAFKDVMEVVDEVVLPEG